MCIRDSYYEDNVAPTEFETPTAEPITEPIVEPELREEAKVEETKKTSSVKAKPGKTKAESKEDDWIEDADGNFVKRGA